MSRIWVTRTEPGATTMAKYLRRVGLEVSVASLIIVEGIKTAPPARSFNAVVYLSQHAVRHAACTWLTTELSIAIGTATQRTLREFNIESQMPDHPSSERLLCYISRRLPLGSTILIVCGEGSRGVLPRRLQSLGFDVHEWCVYRRIAVESCPQLQAECEIVELSSISALESFRKIVTRNAEELDWARCLMVPSRRIAVSALKLGFTDVYVCGDASPRAYATEVKRLLDHV